MKTELQMLKEARTSISKELRKAARAPHIEDNDQHRKMDKGMMKRARSAWADIESAYKEGNVNKMKVACTTLVGQLKSLNDLYQGL